MSYLENKTLQKGGGGKKKSEGEERKRKDQIWGVPFEDGDTLGYISQEFTENSEANLASVQCMFRVGVILTSVAQPHTCTITTAQPYPCCSLQPRINTPESDRVVRMTYTPWGP